MQGQGQGPSLQGPGQGQGLINITGQGIDKLFMLTAAVELLPPADLLIFVGRQEGYDIDIACNKP